MQEIILSKLIPTFCSFRLPRFRINSGLELNNVSWGQISTLVEFFCVFLKMLNTISSGKAKLRVESLFLNNLKQMTHIIILMSHFTLGVRAKRCLHIKPAGSLSLALPFRRVHGKCKLSNSFDQLFFY